MWVMRPPSCCVEAGSSQTGGCGRGGRQSIYNSLLEEVLRELELDQPPRMQGGAGWGETAAQESATGFPAICTQQTCHSTQYTSIKTPPVSSQTVTLTGAILARGIPKVWQHSQAVLEALGGCQFCGLHTPRHHTHPHPPKIKQRQPSVLQSSAWTDLELYHTYQLNHGLGPQLEHQERRGLDFGTFPLG